MVQSTAATGDDLLAGEEDDRLPAIRAIRELCAEHLLGWQERMQWGMPGYGPAGSDALVSFNNQKNYISIYPGRGALEEYRGKLKCATFGGGCVRFAKPDKIDFTAVAGMLSRAYGLKSIETVVAPQMLHAMSAVGVATDGQLSAPIPDVAVLPAASQKRTIATTKSVVLN